MTEMEIRSSNGFSITFERFRLAPPSPSSATDRGGVYQFRKSTGGFRENRGRWCDYIARIRLTSSQSVEAPTETGHRHSVTNEFSDQN